MGTWGTVPTKRQAVTSSTTVLDLDCCHFPLLLDLSKLMGNNASSANDNSDLDQDLDWDLEVDKRLFSRSLNDDSKAYRNPAMELIFLCRFLVQAHEQSSYSSTMLRT